MHTPDGRPGSPRQEAARDAGWFLRPGGAGAAPVRLVCLPYAGGSGAVFRNWAAGLDGAAEVHALTLPGHAHRWRQPLAEDLHRLADDIADVTAPLQDERPLVLLGYSLGGLLAFEVARRLNRRGRAPELLIAAACPPPGLLPEGRNRHTLPDREFIALLRQMGATPEAILDEPEMIGLLLPMLRADFALSERYRYTPGKPLPTPIVTVGGSDDPEIAPAAMASWAEETTLSLTQIVLAGGHLFIHEDEAGLLAHIRDAVRTVANAPARDGVRF
ncbi:alpha/beta fold hydrolase [Streptomyces anulatus]|uniref:thioesterase II family protein n=1 Tax=Streptomyces anulatus TaxID=1892 RepID=UPI00224D5FA2|nr:alpha/beta fold hydrolase [Streptomyces anulatus]MCX4521958.1 alpha/beta fold hydrolase [Streptomyces anulatus]MCX4604834.1 alpha/beta fold hydrolase [Streptomyces anulatus]WTE29657.1 alpha/beta fold hydrolase [Streptomyces anulatus]